MDYQTSLQKAIEWGANLEIVKKLVENGASVNVRWFDYPIGAAVEANDAELVKFLLPLCDFNINDSLDARYKTVLHRACEADEPKIEIVQAILEHGININADDYYGETALHLACKSGNKQIVELLLKYGIDVNYVDEKSESACSAIYCAISEDSTDILQLLLEHGAEVLTVSSTNTSVIKCALYSTNAVKLLLKHVANLSSQLEINWTQFSQAVYNSDIGLVKEMLQNGCEIDMLTLYAAAIIDQDEIFKLIWNNISADLVSNDPNFMIYIFDNWDLKYKFDNLKLILGKEGVNLHLEGCGKAFSFFINRSSFNSINISRSDLSAFVECLVSRGLRLSSAEVQRLVCIACPYYAPTCAELFEIIINKVLPKIPEKIFDDERIDLVPMSVLIPYCLYIEPELVFKTDRYSWEPDVLDYCLSMFTVPDHCKDNILYRTEKWGDVKQRKRIEGILLRMSVKSLQEIARDTVRKELNKICTDSRQFLNILDHMKLPTRIRNILLCRESVNKFV